VRPDAQGGVDVSLLDSYSVRSLMSLDLPHVALKTITQPADVMILELIALNAEYQYEFEWVALQDGRIDAIAYWFVICWSDDLAVTETLPRCHHFPGAPHGQTPAIKEDDAQAPHWRQAAWMLEEGVAVKQGQSIRVRVSCVGSYLSFKVLQ
jgi:hypothetical protein